MRKYFITIIFVVIVASIPLLFLKKDNLGGGLVAKTPDKTCVDLLNLSVYTDEQATQAQNCLKMMIAEIQADGWAIGDQGKPLDKDDIVRLYQQKMKKVNIDENKKLIKKATKQEVDSSVAEIKK